MNLYCLQPRWDDPEGVEESFAGWDVCQRAVVVAASEQEARAMVMANSSGSENRELWLDPKYTDCEEISLSEPQFLCQEVNWG